MRHLPSPRATRAMLPLCLLLAAVLPAAVRAQNVNTFASGLSSARGLAVDASGNIYATRRSAVSTITRFSPPSNAPTVFASGLGDPIDLVFDSAGNLYCTDYSSAGRVWKITPGGTKSVVTTLTNPGALTIDAADNLYVGEYFSGQVFRISPAGLVSLHATMPMGGSERLTALHVGPDGTLYCGSINGTIYKVAAGGGAMFSFATGFGSVLGIVAAPDNVLFVSTYTLNTLRMVQPDGTHTLFAGTGTSGLLDGPLLAARLHYPAGIVMLDGKIYVAEYGNGDIRVLDGLGPVAIEGQTFGSVKAMFR